MQLRRWISFVALLGVLLHAGLLVRHNAVMLNAKLLHSEIAATLGVICHTDGTTARLPVSQIPDVPAQSEGLGDCPICAGLASVAAIVPSLVADITAPDFSSARVAVVGEAIALRLAAVRPPTRGPPRTV